MNVLYFAWLRAKVGVGEEIVVAPEAVTTTGALVEWLKTRSDGHAQAFADLKLVRVAVNQDYVGWDHPIKPADEVAFFPPVTGG
ncbi:molybdopterin converting factor subunit 1 [Magnetospirillum gryphiswaldense]|uniref:Molybdopterin synthase sulfur carrier subunit n=1 Tax=Magnetospirillum gryphiswaldense TaxID=55518 RepID=A4U130_9PROT|nr:molybdopterin converting factor subunit 1 [Magnetospirillum gryphiswaldense]AVM76013.1 Molybdopterin synthase sulfur carrier subunit [Magnetospirillum gryphiswaldense MSR-1]AVM79916.1 Molybdopterin synthase sulfur carrier subunit [Magnetospirillum gryphiswaldense]CAM76587.1 ThiamineS [Magnetospirillum gryphiswaldense MSR-1]